MLLWCIMIVNFIMSMCAPALNYTIIKDVEIDVICKLYASYLTFNQKV